jgi:hypothetical protein
VPAPQLHGAPGVGQLNGVSCASVTMCMDAGWHAGTEQARHPKTLTELGTSSG